MVFCQLLCTLGARTLYEVMVDIVVAVVSLCLHTLPHLWVYLPEHPFPQKICEVHSSLGVLPRKAGLLCDFRTEATLHGKDESL